jgi:VIT family
MGAGEYVSVNSQLELLEASTPSPDTGSALPQLDLDANERALVYRARGISADEAARQAAEVLRELGIRGDRHPGIAGPDPDRRETVGTGLRAGLSSSICFGSGTFIPVLPYLLGLGGVAALVVAAILVGIALLTTGVMTAAIATLDRILADLEPIHHGVRPVEQGEGDSFVAAFARVSDAVAYHTHQGRVREASQLASEHMALLESLGDPTLTVGFSLPPIYAKGVSGEWHDVERWSQRVIDLADGHPVAASLEVTLPWRSQ